MYYSYVAFQSSCGLLATLQQQRTHFLMDRKPTNIIYHTIFLLPQEYKITMTMDLTPQPSATPWWSVFDCCLPPPSSAVADDGEQDQEGAPSCSSLKVLTGGTGIGTEWIKSHPDTPATTCADSSLDYSAGEWYYGVCF